MQGPRQSYCRGLAGSPECPKHIMLIWRVCYPSEAKSNGRRRIGDNREVTSSRGKKRPRVEGPTDSFIRNVLDGYNGSGNGLTKKQKLILESTNIAGRTIKFVLAPL